MLIKDVIESQDAWTEILKQKADVRVSFMLMKYVKMFQGVISEFNEKRTATLMEMSDEDDDGQRRIQNEQIPELNSKLEEFLSKESKLPLFDLTLEELVDVIQKDTTNSVSASTLFSVSMFMKQNEPAKKPKAK